MAGIQEIKDAIVEQGAELLAQGDAIAAELEQLATQPTIDPADVTAVAQMVRDNNATLRANTARIQAMVPDAPPPVPEPTPEPPPPV